MKQKGILIALAITVFVALLFAGCTFGIDVSGTWSGSLTIEGESGYTLDADLDQSGSDITGTSGISYSGIPLTSYDVDATIDGNDIEGDMIGSDASTYDIEFTATVNDAGDNMTGDFYIPDSDASGDFDIDKD